MRTGKYRDVSEEAEQVLIGSLLGDGGLQLRKNGINATFRELHSTNQRWYLLWKDDYLKCFDPRVKESKNFDKRTNKFYNKISLWTKVHPVLTKYYKLLYKKDRKTINNQLLKKIDPLALAVWCCDDGSYGYINKNGKIATYLSYDDNLRLANFLKNKFDIMCSVNKDGKYYHLHFSVKEINKFLRLIRDYVPECMNYKMGPIIEGNKDRLVEENQKRRERDKTRWKKRMSDPVKHERINRRHREYMKRRLKDPEYRRKHNEYHKLKEREYGKKKKQSSGA